MCNVLVPVDGSDNSYRAVGLATRLYGRLSPMTVHVLHVQIPAIGARDESATSEYVDEARNAAEQALKGASEMLDAASVPYVSSVAQGYVASAIAMYVKANGCDAILMGTRGMGSSESLLGSIARQVVQLTDVPVTLVK